MRAETPSPGTALIVRVPGDERVVVPLRAELSSYRFQVVELAERSAGRLRPLVEIAQQYSAQAALRAVGDQVAVELWIEGTEANQPGSVEVVRAGAGAEPNVLVLRVTEVMRARGLRLVLPPRAAAVAVAPAAPRPAAESSSAQATAGTASPDAAPDTSSNNAPARNPAPEREASGSLETPPAKPQAAAPVVAPAMPAPTEESARRAPPSAAPKPSEPKPEQAAEPVVRREAEPAATEPEQPETTSDDTTATPFQLLHVELAAAAAFSAGDPGLSPSANLWAQVRLQPLRIASISLFGLMPLWQAELVETQGSADVRIWSLGGFADLHAPLGPVELSGGLGGASLLINISAHKQAGYKIGNTDMKRIPALLARVGAGLALTPQLRLQARCLAGIGKNELTIRFDTDTVVARWGQPFVVLTLGVDYGF